MAASHLLGWIFFFLCFSDLFDKNGVEGSGKVFLDQHSLKPSIVSKQYRTAYHFQPPEHWINDPNGPMYYNGVYHLFYQYNPKGAQWGNILWAHSVSVDLINWTPLDLAIYPSKPFDTNGCWSGSATILPGNKPAILYTGIDPMNRQVQNIAVPKNLSDPFLREWTKPDYNPIIEPVNGINSSLFRDPTTGWLGLDGYWRVAVGAEIKHMGLAILYRSRDFVHWERAKYALHSSKATGMWECPDFYPVSLKGRLGLDTSVNSGDVKHVLKMSLGETRADHYMLGRYDQEKDIFVPENVSVDDYRLWLRYDRGNFYASKTFFDSGKKRRILWGWSNESDSSTDDVLKGWAGIQIIPRVVWLDSNGRQLVQWPVKELESFRRKEVILHDIELKTGELFEIKGINESQADVEVDFHLSSLERAESFDPTWEVDPQMLCGEEDGTVQGGIGPFGLLVLASNSLDEHTAVFFRIFKAHNRYVVLMCSDQRRSSLRPEVYKPAFGGFVDVDIEKDGKISLRTLIDHSVVESFGGGGRTRITARVYPTMLLTDNTHLYAFNNGSEVVKISKLSAWNMAKPRINIQEGNPRRRLFDDPNFV